MKYNNKSIKHIMKYDIKFTIKYIYYSQVNKILSRVDKTTSQYLIYWIQKIDNLPNTTPYSINNGH